MHDQCDDDILIEEVVTPPRPLKNVPVAASFSFPSEGNTTGKRWVSVKQKKKPAAQTTANDATVTLQSIQNRQASTQNYHKLKEGRPLLSVRSTTDTNRQRSLIFFNVPENDADAAQNCLTHDCNQITETVQRLLAQGDATVAVHQVYRLGSKPANSRPRPLKVVFGSVEIALFFFSRGYRLRGQNVSMKADLSPEDRERQKKAVQELKTRTSEGEKDLIVVNFRVVRRRKMLTSPLMITISRE
jgi:hypothetical protein